MTFWIYGILFFGATVIIIHTVVLFPIIVRLIAKHYRARNLYSAIPDVPLPSVSVLISALNEERNLPRRLDNLAEQVAE
ncbi:MAG: hypothetical protein JNL32_16310, partial [Candidatus Kapabacteria bacterium]|nr:hypothetical protein [Candidatus Kapabacteria bacterium]